MYYEESKQSLTIHQKFLSPCRQKYLKFCFEDIKFEGYFGIVLYAQSDNVFVHCSL